MAKAISVGQQWRARNGVILRVTGDRGEDQQWRWALSNSELADADGRVDPDPKKDHPHDLEVLMVPQGEVTMRQTHMEGVDSMMQGLNDAKK